MTDNDNSYILLGTSPINGSTPAGDDARYETEYTTILEEIEKMSFSSEGSETSWRNVEKNAVIILSQKSKDLQVCTHLGVALCHTKGILGFLCGMQVLMGYMENFWENGWPSLKRMRGRMNALLWWQESAQKFIQNLLDKDVCAENTVSTSMQQELLAALTTLDALLAEKAPDAPPLRPLRILVERLNIEAPPVAVEPVVTPAAEVAPQLETQEENRENFDENKIQSQSQDGLADSTSKQIVKTQQVTDRQAVDTPQKNIRQGNGLEAIPATQVLEDDETSFDNAENIDLSSHTDTAAATHSDIDDSADTIAKAQALQKLLDENKDLVTLRQNYSTSMLAYAAKLSKLAPQLPLSWQLARNALFGSILHLPPLDAQQSNEKNKITFIPPPETDALARAADILKNSSNLQSLSSSVLSLENIFLSAPLFLDVQKAIHATLVALGAEFSAAARVVHHESATFFQRLQELEYYAFNDGTPFMNTETVRWLKTELHKPQTVAAPQIKMQSSDCATINKTLDKARKFMLNNDIDKALSILDAQKNASVANNTRICVYQIHFLCQAGKIDTACSLATSVLKIVDKHKLDHFDPDLAIFCLSAVHTAYSLNEKKNGKHLPKLCRRMAWLSPTVLLK